MDRNELSFRNSAIRMSNDDFERYFKILHDSEYQVKSLISINTMQDADRLTYCSICENWRGSQLHCTVYNLKFARYIEEVQKSWGHNNTNSAAEYMKIWADSAKVLIISNIDFVNFKEFQSQLFLSLIQQRMSAELTTIIVTPKVSSLVGDGPFFARLTEILNACKVVE